MNARITSRTRRALLVGLAAAASAALLTGTASAWKPMAYIYKDVENVTTKSDVYKADTQASGLIVHPGDTLVFHITITNYADGQYDQMVNTNVTDQLPAGLQLIKQDSFDYGTVAPRQSVKRTVTAKVTSTTAGLIKNEACFTGISAENTNPQKGCDAAYIKVVVPTPSPSASATPSPTASATPSPTASASPSPSPTGDVLGDDTEPTLPDTGPASIIASTIGLGAMATAGAAYIRSRRKM